ncbi:AAA family ATPase [Burkholderia vietnamiensis]|nr:AAA family ATPase [Burkholderia vietnamiensis]
MQPTLRSGAQAQATYFGEYIVQPKHHLTVHKFGPINQAEIGLNQINILIGPQSSGKSTISKLAFFFLNLRDEFIEFILDAIEDSSNDEPKLRDFIKITRRRFVEFWGPSPQKSDVFIKYHYTSDTWATISLDSEKHRYTNPEFSTSIIDALHSIYREASSIVKRIDGRASSKLFSTVDNISESRSRSDVISLVKHRANELFAFERELLFIPAGRSLLSTLSDQLQFIHPHQLDYPLRSFIERINHSKSFFSRPIDELIQDRQLLGSEPIRYSAVRKVEGLIKRILKGEYIHDKDGGKLFVDKKTYTKISFASSGQQESVWILLSLFLVILEKINASVFIEEPEAHLFPVAQAEMVELLCFIANSLGTQFFVTTHSPYFLSAINNHLYAGNIATRTPTQVSQIMPENEWLKAEQVSGLFVNNGTVENLVDDELGLLKVELIDNASSLINTQYEELFEVDRASN